MNQPLFTGVCTALVTPFLDNKINYPMLEQLLRRQIDAGIPAVVICGTTGESPTITDEEKLEMFYRCVQYAKGKCKIIAGTGSNSTEHTVYLSRAAEETGVDGLLLVSPYYNKSTPDGLVAHYMTVAHSINLPIILYNVPGRTGVDIPVSVYKRLCKTPNIVGIKEASDDITKIVKIQKACGDNLSIWSGNDSQILPAIASGAQGVISVVSNVLPHETLALANAIIAGDYKTGRQLQIALSDAIDLMFCEVNPIPVKAALNVIGYDCGRCRLPLSELTPTNQKKILDYFK